MNEAVREELIRFGKTFVARLKFVVGWTLVGTLFLFFYAGIKANYVTFEVLAAASLTLSVIVCAAILAVIVHAYSTRRKERER